jgi:hypothetical protein
MRLQLILPRMEPTNMNVPSVCPYEDCQGGHFRHHQQVDKAVKDTRYATVFAERYECLRCQRTFRVYPQGATRDQMSQRVKGLGVLLYLLGLSYGATSLALEALGVYMCKTSVYEAVQAVAEKVPGLKRQEVFGGLRTPALGSDLTSVKRYGEWLHLGLTVDDTTGLVLTIDELSAEDTETIQAWLEPIAQAVAAELLVSDDADAFKTVAEGLGLEHQVCKSHGKRNTETFIENLTAPVASDADGSLAAIGVTSEQALEDLKHLGELILSRQRQEEEELETMHQRYIHAPPPSPRQKATVAYRLRLMYLDRWNLWRPLTRYRLAPTGSHLARPLGGNIDGTNNGCERAIGWWVKERYRLATHWVGPCGATNAPSRR